MKIHPVLAAASLSAAALIPNVWSAGTQAGPLDPVAPGARQGLIRVLPGETDLDEGVSAQDVEHVFDRRAWRERLLDHDLDSREVSFDELVVLARSSDEVREVLEAWSEDDYELELAWTARLVLRELERAPVGSVPDAFDPWGKHTPFSRPDPRDMQGLQQRMRDLERDIDQWFRLPRGSSGPWGIDRDPLDLFHGLPLDGRSMSGPSFRMQTGPDGVRVEVEVDENGEKRTETYEAESLEELLRLHPELEGRLGRVTVPGLPGLLDDMAIQVPDMPAVNGIRTDVLGVMMSEPVPDRAQAEGLAPGVGLLVESVLPRSIASELGVRRGDVLLELEGRELRSGEDVRKALAERGEGEAVDLVLLRDGERQSTSWQP